jgi:hypothetical protein
MAIPSPGNKGATKVITQHRSMVERYIRAYNEFNLEDMLSFLTKDCVFENISNSGNSVICTGLEEIRKIATQAKAAFRNREQTVRNWIVSDNKIAIEIDYRAELAIDLSDTLKAGQQLVLRGMSVFEFSGNKISRIADYS